jgi:MoxR-like ATPase
LVSTTPFNAAQGSAGPADLVAEVEALGERLRLVRDRIGEVIFGQREVVEQALITLLSGGHALLIGVPGLAKTRLVETLGTIPGLDDKRIQCTRSDAGPIFSAPRCWKKAKAGGARSALPGPVFCQLLMADEINRASPRTQSALLRRCRRGGCRSPASTTCCHSPSCWRPRTRSSRKAPTRRRKPSSTGFAADDVDYPDRDAERLMLIATTLWRAAAAPA